MLRSLLFISSLCLFLNSYGQINVQGRILGDSLGLPGATVQNKYSEKGTLTDFDGTFNIQANDGDVLLVSYLGYEKDSIVVKENEKIRLELKQGIALSEVVVSAYGSRATRCFMCCGYTTTTVHYYDEKQVSKSKVYPNPSPDGYFDVSSNQTKTITGVVVYDFSGRIISREHFSKGLKLTTLNLTNESSGIYLAKITFDDHSSEVKKLIKR